MVQIWLQNNDNLLLLLNEIENLLLLLLDDYHLSNERNFLFSVFSGYRRFTTKKKKERKIEFK